MKFKVFSDPNYWPAVQAVLSQSFGVEEDMKLVEVYKDVSKAHDTYSELKLKKVRELGLVDPTTGGYTMAGAPAANIEPFQQYMEQLHEREFPVCLAEPMKLVRKAIHSITPLTMGLVHELFDFKPEVKG